MPPSISQLIGAAEEGDFAGTDALFSALYAELHRLAQRELARPGASVSLGVTTLLHEAYLDMAAHDGPSFPDLARYRSNGECRGPRNTARWQVKVFWRNAPPRCRVRWGSRGRALARTGCLADRPTWMGSLWLAERSDGRFERRWR